MVAGDEECYEVFKEIFDPVIDERHNGYRTDQLHPTDLDASKIRAGTSTLNTYSPLESGQAGASGDFPSHHIATEPREEWWKVHNDAKNFLVWVNEEDHTRLISMEKGGNMKAVFDRFCQGLNEVESLIKSEGWEYMWNEHLGYILTCPSNLGTGLRAGVHVKLPNLGKDPRFDDILEKLRLQKRGTGGVDTESTNGIFDISNLDRLGQSEVQLVQQVIDGVDLLVKMEKQLEKSRPISSLMPNIFCRNKLMKPEKINIETDLVARLTQPCNVHPQPHIHKSN
ncbi:creatine kinase, mitochondrial [Apostichopus japonicus]|uniref:Creatine kinase, mitochondrial n=1 Tax=Stichopus japonicus TaxID=307972 RepID=A0A2G8JGI3_STIJA|nr:creatine kinase, mitochondrial [Apostichopus japonicus]